MTDLEKNVLCSLAAEIRAGGFSEEITVSTVGDQVVGVTEIVKVHRPYVSNWEYYWKQATVSDLEDLVQHNFLQPHPKGGGRYWLDSNRILAECDNPE